MNFNNLSRGVSLIQPEGRLCALERRQQLFHAIHAEKRGVLRFRNQAPHFPLDDRRGNPCQLRLCLTVHPSR